MPDPRTVLSTFLFILWYPTSKLLSFLALVLSPFWAVLQFVFLPLTYLLHALYSILSFPFRLNILERIETIYIWVGVAGLIGCITGGIVFVVFRFITAALQIDGAAEARESANGRSIKEFRAARRTKKEPHAGSPYGPRVDKVAALRRRGLVSQPILEDDSEF